MTSRLPTLLLLACFFTSTLRGAHAADPKAAAKKEAQKQFDLGRKYQDLGKFDEAVAEYQRAYDLVPAPPMLFNIGQAYRLKGDARKALEFYEKFLGVQPNGAGTSEARKHIKTVRQQIAVEDANAARAKAEAEAEAARRAAAAEVEAARKREAEAARREAEARRTAEVNAESRKKLQAEEEVRIKRLAAEMEAAARKKREQDEADRKRRLAEAEEAGGGVRVAGSVLMFTGLVVAALGAIPLSLAMKENSKLQRFNQGMGQWTDDLQKTYDRRQNDQKLALQLAVGGGISFVLGIVIYRVGIGIQSGAVEDASKAPATTLLPAVGPNFAGLDLRRSF